MTETTNTQPEGPQAPEPEANAKLPSDPSKSARARAPRPRARDGASIAERLQQRRSAQQEINAIRRKLWLRRLLVLGGLASLLYFVIIPLIRVEFYVAVARNSEGQIHWAADQLVKTGAPRSVPILIRALHGKNANRRAIYYRAISDLAQPEHRADIFELIGSQSAQDRRCGLYAIYILSGRPWLKDSETLKLLIRSLESDPDPLCRIYSAMIFEKNGAPAPEQRAALIKGVADPETSVRSYCIKALADCNDPALAPIFIEALADSQADVRWPAAHALAAIGDPTCVAALSERYENGEEWERREVVKVLDQIEHDSVTRLLLHCASDRAADIAALALKHLARRDGGAIDRALLEALDSAETEVRIVATRSLAGRGVHEALPDLIDNLRKYEGWRELEALDESLHKLTKAVDIPAPSGQPEAQQRTVKAWLRWFREQR